MPTQPAPQGRCPTTMRTGSVRRTERHPLSPLDLRAPGGASPRVLAVWTPSRLSAVPDPLESTIHLVAVMVAATPSAVQSAQNDHDRRQKQHQDESNPVERAIWPRLVRLRGTHAHPVGV